MRNKIPWISNEDVISAFSTGVTDIKMKEKLSANDELTSIVRLFEIADRCAKAEEGRLFVHNLPETPPQKSKSEDPKCKEATALAMEPNHKQRRGDRSEHDKGGWCRYCILHKKDTTILMIVGLSENSMKRMESPSDMGVAIATAREVPEVTTATTTEMRVTGGMTHRA
jgi:hypothetical protein